MAIVTTDNQYYSDIAAAIRKKLGVSRQYRPDEMAAAIESIGAAGTQIKFSGNPIVATDTIESQPFASLKIYGKTAQDETSGLVNAGQNGNIELVINGKNLFPIGTYDASGKQYAIIGADSSSKAQEYFCAKSGQQVSISFDAANPSECKLFFACLGYGETYFNKQFTPNITGNRISSTITLDRDVDKIGFSIHPVQSVFPADFMFSNIQAELNSEATAYEQYAAQPLIPSTPSGLPGVPVSSGGNCTDSTGQSFTSDYWDFAAGLQHILCGQIASYDGEEITTPYISSTGSLTTGAKVVYVLPEPQTQPIPTETLAAYHALTTYAGTTVISTAEPVAGMEATVYCDAGATVQRLQGEIQTLSHTNTQLSRTVNTLPDAE